jgi:hypothetical protein
LAASWTNLTNSQEARENPCGKEAHLERDNKFTETKTRGERAEGSRQQPQPALLSRRADSWTEESLPSTSKSAIDLSAPATPGDRSHADRGTYSVGYTHRVDVYHGGPMDTDSNTLSLSVTCYRCQRRYTHIAWYQWIRARCRPVRIGACKQ